MRYLSLISVLLETEVIGLTHKHVYSVCETLENYQQVNIENRFVTSEVYFSVSYSVETLQGSIFVNNTLCE